MSNVSLIDFSEDQLEAFLSGRLDSTPTLADNGLQLLADVATTEADTKGVLFRSDGAQEGLRPEAAGSDRARTGSKPDGSWVETGCEPETGRADLGQKRPPCSFGRRWGFKEECQPEVRPEGLRRRARADASGSNRGCRRRRQRYRSSSSDGGSDWGRENPSGRNGQPANYVKRNRRDRPCDGNRSTPQVPRRHGTTARSGRCDAREIRRPRCRSSSSDGGSDWGRESPCGRKRQPANYVGRNHEGRRYSSLSESEDRSASPIRGRRRTPTQNGSRETEKPQRPLKDRSTTSNQSHCKATDSRQTAPQPGTSRGRYGFTVGAKLGTYDGSTCLETFLARFDNCARYFKWSEEDRLFQLCASLTGPAGQILWDAGTQTTVNEVERLLRNRFGNINQAERFRAELRARRRKPGESLQKLYQDVCRLMALAYPGPSTELSNVVARDAFLDALDSNNLRIRILEREPVSLDDALKLACRFEAFDKTSTQPVQETRPNRDKEKFVKRVQQCESDMLKELQQGLRECCSQMTECRRELEALKLSSRSSHAGIVGAPCGNSFDPRRGSNVHRAEDNPPASMAAGTSNTSRGGPPRKSNSACHRCGQEGHWARSCPQARTRQEVHSQDGPGQDSLGAAMLQTLADRKNGAAVYMPLRLFGRKTLALLDSGCDTSVVGRRHLPAEIEIRPTRRTLFAANGSRIPLLGEATLVFQVYGIQHTADVVVTDVIDELILGIDWLAKEACRWDFARECIGIGDRWVQLRSQPKRASVKRICAKENMDVPPRSQVSLPIRVVWRNLESDGSACMLEPKELGEGIMAARTLFDGNAFCSAVQIINLSNAKYKVAEGMCLGEAQEVLVHDPVVSTTAGGRSDPQSDDLPVAVVNCQGPELEPAPGPASGSLQRPGCGPDCGPHCRQFSTQSLNVADSDVCLEDHSSDQDLESRQTFIKGTIVEAEVPQPLDDVGHLQAMIDSLSRDLSQDEKDAAIAFIQRNADMFSRSEFDLGLTDMVEHTIETGTNRPVKQALRRHPIAQLPLIDQHVEEMLKNGIIQPMPGSEWISNVVLVRKSDGSLRYCIDYRGLNAVTTKANYPLPRIDACLDSLGGNSYFSTLDMRSSYWQVKVAEKDRDKTCFVTRKGIFGFKVLSFGLCNAPSTFQRLVDLAFAGLTWEICLAYLDDVIVFSRSFEDHITRLSTVFDRLRKANLKLKPSKCNLFQTKVKFLGSVVSGEGIEPDPAKVEAVTSWPRPVNVTEVRGFVALASYYRRHIEHFAEIARPLHELTRKNVNFYWEEKQEESFQELKNRLTSAPLLAMPVEDGSFVLDTDASSHALGAVLQQWQGGILRVIGYASRVLNPAETRYCTTRKELAGIMFGLKYYRHFLVGKHFELRTDHAALTYLLKTPEPVGQAARYLDTLAEFDFSVVHRPGAQHRNCDALSRRPCSRDPGQPPCRQCRPEVESADGDNVEDNAQFVDVGRQGPELESASGPVSGSLQRPGCGSDCGRQNDEDICVYAARTGQNQFSSSLSRERIAEEQVKDSVLNTLRQWILTPDSVPEQGDLLTMDPDIQDLYAQRQTLEIRDGVLYRRIAKYDGQTDFYQVLVPRALRAEFLDAVHNGALNGHFGVQKTQQKLRDIAYWKGWMRDVKSYVGRCDTCGRYRRGPKRRQGKMQKALGCTVMQKVHCDLTGPHPTSRYGYKYLLTVICSFSKYLLAVPIRDKTSLTVARALVKHVYLVHGAPQILVHDLGGEFWSEVMTELARILGIHVSKITSKRAQSNGVVERVHATLHGMYAKLICSNQRNWCELTPYVTYAYNTAYHSSMAYSPFFLMFMRRPHSVIELQIETPTLASPETTEEFVEEVSERMRTAHAFVREHLKCGFDRAKQRYDARIKSMQFKVGDLVWYYMPKYGANLNRKWMLASQGPYRVVRSINDVNKVIQRSPTSKPIIVHIDRLTHYHGDIPACWMGDIRATQHYDTPVHQAIRTKPIPEQSTDIRSGEASSDSVQPEPRHVTSRRQRRAPAHLADYVNMASSSGARVCSRCDMTFQSVAGWKKHLLSFHREVWTADGRMRPAAEDEIEARLAALRRGQFNSHRRRAEKQKAGTAASPPPPASRLCRLREEPMAVGEEGAAAAAQLLMEDLADVLPEEVDVGVQASVDVRDAAAGPSRPPSRHRRVGVQATTELSSTGVGDGDARVRSRATQRHWPGNIGKLPAGLSLADVVKAVTEGAGQPPGVIASRMLRGRDPPPEETSMLQTYCLVAAAAQRAAGLAVYDRATTASSDDAALRRLCAWATEVASWDLPEVQLREPAGDL